MTAPPSRLERFPPEQRAVLLRGYELLRRIAEREATRRGLTVEQLAEALDAATTATEPPTPAPTVTDSTD